MTGSIVSHIVDSMTSSLNIAADGYFVKRELVNLTWPLFLQLWPLVTRLTDVILPSKDKPYKQ